MPQFAYEARDERGELSAGLIVADSIERAGKLLSDRNLFVVRVAAERTGAFRPKQKRGHATKAEAAWQLSQLTVMLQTGMRLIDGLDILARQATRPRLRTLLEEIRAAVEQGRPFSDALAMYPRAFPGSVTALVRASEMSGTFTAVLRQCSSYLLSEVQCLRKVRGALMYPAFMLIACLSVTAFLLMVILPKFESIFASRGALLPAPTRLLMSASELVTTTWYAWVPLSVGALVGLTLWLRTSTGKRQLDTLALATPLFSGIFNRLYQGRAFRTLGALLQSGVLLTEALRIIQQVVPNVHYQDLWRRVASEIERGERMAGPLLESPLIPEHIAQMIDNGDRAGKLAAIFSQLAELVEDEYNRAVAVLMQFIEPCMILVMGALVGFVSISLLLPLFQASRIVTN